MMMSDMRQLLQLCAKIPVNCALLHDSKAKESAPGVKLVLEPVSRTIADPKRTSPACSRGGAQ